jgi:hypothetical protein
MTNSDIEFLKNAIICVNDVDKRKEWRVNEGNLMKLVELSEQYGWEVVDKKIQEIKELS